MEWGAKTNFLWKIAGLGILIRLGPSAQGNHFEKGNKSRQKQNAGLETRDIKMKPQPTKVPGHTRSSGLFGLCDKTTETIRRKNKARTASPETSGTRPGYDRRARQEPEPTPRKHLVLTRANSGREIDNSIKRWQVDRLTKFPCRHDLRLGTGIHTARKPRETHGRYTRLWLIPNRPFRSKTPKTSHLRNSHHWPPEAHGIPAPIS